MTDMLPFETVLRGKKIFVTGHSGFTGSWLSTWFDHIGVEQYGYSLAPDQTPALADLLGVADMVPSETADIMNYDRLAAAITRFQPDVIIHLAAQPLVRRSYREPLRTFAVNALGTAHVLEAARHTPSVRGVVCITTDKVYENREWDWAYRENDPIGGKDPYSASKAAAEMVIKGYASSFSGNAGGPAIATARGGNIIGGGDWSEDRLVPDFVRAVVSGEQLTLRFPDATRPWQHVLALVQGYGMLAAGLLSNEPQKYARAWNLGPRELQQYPVRRVMEILATQWQRPDLVYLDAPLPEAGALALDSRLAHDRLGWQAPWSVEEMIRQTAAWYRAYYERAAETSPEHPVSMRDVTLGQIEAWRRGLMQVERT
ncbi:CDP-glucose 4,6-dehydratase [Aurantimonas endophytica]|uniref:CDP-glucose 4,6-dehydratase n=1 Tax=Aurantimonas endophytica TaxID=1522175 RepID=A0A7W6HDI7_9HYPH|nr:CDP-glucose 4,6-dehydratase [Aurantimonas endophytica]MBB4003082.1 CDP-glucose 4,6-dehydratase [Aurantimonas endophytica]MCO6403954.1 CDP-glucose 4,6-dehydratase [Aurantimonas endophytica]